MRLKKKIILYFSLAFVGVFGVALLTVYVSMSQYREEQFAERLKEKTTTTLRLLIDFKNIDHDLLQALDETTINNLYDEKILLFDHTGRNVYTSVDDTAISFPQEILKRLEKGEDEIFYVEGIYDVYAHKINIRGATYYAIGKANDRDGRERLLFLGWIVLAVFICSLLVVITLATYISRQITGPLEKFAKQVNEINANNLSPIIMPPSRDEISVLVAGFNEMLSRVSRAYVFQRHLIQHISHELKTPLAVLISNLERKEAEHNNKEFTEYAAFQKAGLMQMADIINTLLDLSKLETGLADASIEHIRVDEIISSCFDNLQSLYADARFELILDNSVKDAEELLLNGNQRLLHIAFMNLIKNGIEYSEDRLVKVRISTQSDAVVIDVLNNGPSLSEEEQKNLYSYFFRGANSKNKSGIGLGLVLTSRVIQMHSGEVSYSITDQGQNCFSVNFNRSLSNS